MEKETRFTQIESYINQTLEGNSLVEFEKALQEDKILAQEVELLRDLNEAMDDAPLQKRLNEQLDKLGNDYILTEKKISKTGVKQKKQLIAFFVFVAVAVSAFFFWNSLQKNKVSTAVFADHFAPYPFDEATRGENSTDDDYQKAMEYYQRGNYAETLPILQEKIVASPDNIALKILLGNCFLNVNPPQNKAAIALFNTIAADQSHVFVETAEWYLALSLLQDNQKEAAQSVLETLKKKKIGKYPKLAKKLLKEL